MGSITHLKLNARRNLRPTPATATARVVFRIDAEPDKPVTLVKYITYHTSRFDKTDELRLRAERTLDRVVHHGFPQLVADQQAYLHEFWERSDIQINPEHPRLQQCLHWNLFQLLQASARADGHGIAAKGLTGQAYDGHYFWDMEMYILPFLVYTYPAVRPQPAAVPLRHARRRAATGPEVGQKGALFPWRTIRRRRGFGLLRRRHGAVPHQRRDRSRHQ